MQDKDSTSKRLQGITILHVEDDPIIQLHMRTILEAHADAYHTAGDGEKGLKAYTTHRPDIVITDIRMPAMNGLEMAARIREQSPHVPIIVTSAYSDTDFLLEAIELGVDKYIVKPFNQDNVLQTVARIADDILSKRRYEEAYRLSKFLLDINPNFIVTLSGGRVEYINTTFLEYLGYDSLEDFRRDEVEMDAFISPADEGQHMPSLADLGRLGNTGTMVRLRSPNPDCGEGYFLVSGNHLPNSDVCVVSFTDITRLEVEKQSLAFQASTDHLTGLCNRMTFTRLLAEEIGRVRRHALPSCLLMFDLDDFKHVNDTYGHNVGDEVLSGVADIIARSIRQGDILSRWGGEEFLLLAPGCNMDQGQRLAEKLRKVLAAGVYAECDFITASFGGTLIRPDDTVQGLVDRVDRAMYQSKRQGKNRVSVL